VLVCRRFNSILPSKTGGFLRTIGSAFKRMRLGGVHESGTHDAMTTALPSDGKTSTGSAYCIYDVLNIFTEAQLQCYLKRRLSSLRIQSLSARYLLMIKPYAHFLQDLTPLSAQGLPFCTFVQCNVESTSPVRVAYNCPDKQTVGVLFCGQQRWNKNSVVRLQRSRPGHACSAKRKPPYLLRYGEHGFQEIQSCAKEP